MVGKLLPQLLDDRRHVRGGRFQGGRARESTDHLEAAAAPNVPASLSASDRRPQLGVLGQGEVKVRWQDANEHVRLGAGQPRRLQGEGLAENVGTAAEPPLPRAVRDHDRRRRCGSFVFRAEVASDLRRNAERAKELARDSEAWDALGSGGSRHREARPDIKRGDRAERAAALPPIRKSRYDTPPRLCPAARSGLVPNIVTRRDGSPYGRGLIIAASTKPNKATLAAIPSEGTTTAAAP